MALSPLYTCRDCGDGLDPTQSNIYRLVRGWVKGSTRSVTIENEEYVYLHSWCFDTRHLNGNRQDSLF
jgi:hypothetical protein